MTGLTAACPWHHNYSVGALAADSVVRLVNASTETLPAVFHASLFKRLARLRRGFTLDLNGVAGEDARFAGAVLAKLAQRGFPSPCSLTLERFLLSEAKRKNLLNYSEHIEAGAYLFFSTPYRQWQNLPVLLKACFLSELLLDLDESEALLDRYRSLSTIAERGFFDLVCRYCPDPRLPLFLIPQRLLVTMVRLTRPEEELQALAGGRRVDFAVEVPDLSGEGWLRIVVEIDDPSHEAVQQEMDAQRDAMLRNNGWKVWRLQVREKAVWEACARELATSLAEAITDDVLQAAQIIRKLPQELRQALTDLVWLPITEAQLIVAIARWLHAKGTAAVGIANPQGLNLQPVLESIGECLTHLELLYGLPSLDRPTLVDREADADLIYFGLPSTQIWDRLPLPTPGVLAPLPVFSDYEEPLLTDALPRSVSAKLAENPSELENVLTYFLQYVFRKEKFRSGQVAIIRRELQLKPVVGLLPTAAGKSLCYQMAALLQPGFTIVVQPLRALMWDQQDNLDALGIHRTIAIMSHGEVTPEEESALSAHFGKIIR